MEIRKGRKAVERTRVNPFLSLCLTLISSWVLTSGCGVPGEPVPPSPAIPTAVKDLLARQLGDGVMLSFTLPSKSTLGERLTQTPTMEVYRGRLQADGTPEVGSFRLVDTVPGPVLMRYVHQGTVEFVDAVSPDEIRVNPGELVVYSVRTRVSERKASADSNLAQVNLYPVPERIEKIEVAETERSLQLSWKAPEKMSGGGAIVSILEYHVYRGELDPASMTEAEKDIHAAAWKLPPLEIAAPKEPAYQDKGFDYGKTYVYMVRSVIREAGVTRESGDSTPAIVTPKDIFPPESPRDVVAAVLPGGPVGTNMVDLSWSLNVETDLAGYRIYRSESEGSRGEALNQELLPTPSYRDASVQSGHRYWYSVTAMDRAGNESGPSPVVTVEIP